MLTQRGDTPAAKWLLQLLEADVPPHHVVGRRVLGTVHLQGDEPLRRHVVLQIGGGHAVDPSLDRVPFALDAVLVPIVVLERLAGLGGVLQVVQPATTTFVVDATRPGSVARVDFNLVAVHAASGNLLYLASHVDRLLLIVEALTANLNARVHAVFDLEFDFEYEVAV